MSHGAVRQRSQSSGYHRNHLRVIAKTFRVAILQNILDELSTLRDSGTWVTTGYELVVATHALWNVVVTSWASGVRAQLLVQPIRYGKIMHYLQVHYYDSALSSSLSNALGPISLLDLVDILTGQWFGTVFELTGVGKYRVVWYIG